MASPDGGMEIEKVAEETPDRIFKVFLDPALGLQPFQARQLAFALELKGDQIGKAARLMMRRLAGLSRQRRVARRDQPAHRDGVGRPRRARRQADLRRQRAVPPSRIQGAARISAKKIRSRSKRRSSRSTTSSSTARSAAWSTAPASPWRRWTSSSWRAGNRRTSSTLAAAPTPSRSRTRSAS